MKQRILTLVGTAALLAGAVAGPATAGGAVRAFYPEDYDAYEHFDAGEGLCVDWPGTSHEVRRGGYRLVSAPGGQQPGELHVNGVIEGSVELVPDDTALPTYVGDYREKVNGVLTVTIDGDDVERVGQYRLRSTLHGTDGSRLDLALSGKLTFNAKGTVTVDRESFTCG